MADNIKTSMNSIPVMPGEEESVVVTKPKITLKVDELSYILAFLRPIDFGKGIKDTGSIILAKAAVQSTHFKRAKFKGSVEQMIKHLKLTGNREQADRLTLLISTPIFRSPTVMYSQKVAMELKEQVIIILSTLDNPTLFALKDLRNPNVIEELGFSEADFAEILIRGTSFEQTFMEIGKEESKDQAYIFVARGFIEKGDYRAAMTMAMPITKQYFQFNIVRRVSLRLIANNLSQDEILQYVESVGNKEMKDHFKSEFPSMLAEKKFFRKSIRLLDAIKDHSDREYKLFDTLDCMVSKGVLLDGFKRALGQMSGVSHKDSFVEWIEEYEADQVPL